MLGRYGRHRGGQRRLELLLGLLWLLAAGEGAWSLERQPAAPARQALPPEPRLHVVVHQGRLSVELYEAEVGEVLARLSQQAGLAVVVPVVPGRRISTRFANLALADGLHRLLRLADLSYALVSAQDRAGARSVPTLYVLGRAGGAPPPRIPASRRALTEPANLVALLYEQALLAGLTECKSDEPLLHLVAHAAVHRSPWLPRVVTPEVGEPDSEELEVDEPEEVEAEADEPEEVEAEADRPTP